MRPYDLIKKKRDGAALSERDIKTMIALYMKGEFTDYHMSAFTMATFFKGMTVDETVALTVAMRDSGQVVNLDHVAGIKVDKHSTGGVGDKISLPLAPAVAALGVPVPMISGRGLGHTGGTLDKLESIPGFNVHLDLETYRRQVAALQCCLIGQTAEIAPADKKLYALRDVTATVDCLPLICASIMSKKMAEGIDALVLDVKFGSGAFMKAIDDARLLAQTMVDIGHGMGKRVVARLTNMEQPLGMMIGNALEVQESLDVLEGKGPSDVVELTVELGAEMLVLAQHSKTLEEGRQAMGKVLSDGRALEHFGRIIHAQHGDARVIHRRDLLPQAPHQREIVAQEEGVVQQMDCEAIGIASMLLGGGRAKSSDVIDPRVGIEIHVRLGQTVQKGQLLYRLHTADRGVEEAIVKMEQGIIFAPKGSPVPLQPLLGERIVHSKE